MVCQHERPNNNLPFTVFDVDHATKRVTAVAIVPGGDSAVRSSISIPYLPKVEPSTSPVPANTHGAAAAPVTVKPAGHELGAGRCGTTSNLAMTGG